MAALKRLKAWWHKFIHPYDEAVEYADSHFLKTRIPKQKKASECPSVSRTVYTTKTMTSSDGGLSGSVERRPATDKEIKAFNEGFAEMDKAWAHFDRAFDHFDKL